MLQVELIHKQEACQALNYAWICFVFSMLECFVAGRKLMEMGIERGGLSEKIVLCPVFQDIGE